MKNKNNHKEEVATFGAGCFWGVQAAFEKIKGVIRTEVGYAGGKTKTPTYELVCAGDTGHAEVVKIVFNPNVTSYEKLLDVFWSIHDPTQVDGQGYDLGDQYRSVIFFHSNTQKVIAKKFKEVLQRSGEYSKKIATSIERIAKYYRAEEYHQYYLKKKDQGSCLR